LTYWTQHTPRVHAVIQNIKAINWIKKSCVVPGTATAVPGIFI